MENNRQYIENIIQYGPVFLSAKHLGTLNFHNDSLLGEKWTTQLCEKDVEVMPIIFENDDYKAEVDNYFYHQDLLESSPSERDLLIEPTTLASSIEDYEDDFEDISDITDQNEEEPEEYEIFDINSAREEMGYEDMLEEDHLDEISEGSGLEESVELQETTEEMFGYETNNEGSYSDKKPDDQVAILFENAEETKSDDEMDLHFSCRLLKPSIKKESRRVKSAPCRQDFVKSKSSELFARRFGGSLSNRNIPEEKHENIKPLMGVGGYTNLIESGGKGDSASSSEELSKSNSTPSVENSKHLRQYVFEPLPKTIRGVYCDMTIELIPETKKKPTVNRTLFDKYNFDFTDDESEKESFKLLSSNCSSLTSLSDTEIDILSKTESLKIS